MYIVTNPWVWRLAWTGADLGELVGRLGQKDGEDGVAQDHMI